MNRYRINIAVKLGNLEKHICCCKKSEARKQSNIIPFSSKDRSPAPAVLVLICIYYVMQTKHEKHTDHCDYFNNTEVNKR